MTILKICDNPDILRIFKMIRITINIIRILVPLLLIISLMYTIIKTYFIEDLDRQKQHFEGITSSALKKTLAAILVFFIPTFIVLLIDAAGIKGLGYTTCISNANNQGISEAYVKQAQKYVAIANRTIVRSDYNKAVSEVNNAKNLIEKYDGNTSDLTELEKELADIEKKVIQREEEIKKQKEEEEKKRREQASLTPGANGFAWPINIQSTITACFKTKDAVHDDNGHSGIDISVPKGTAIYAVKAGKVVGTNSPGPFPYNTIPIKTSSQCLSLGLSCGNYVLIEHENGIRSKYCHMNQNSITVKKGDIVNLGEKIGEVGSSGCSTGPHLHLTIINGTQVNPLNYIKPVNVKSNPC